MVITTINQVIITGMVGYNNYNYGYNNYNYRNNPNYRYNNYNYGYNNYYTRL